MRTQAVAINNTKKNNSNPLTFTSKATQKIFTNVIEDVNLYKLAPNPKDKDAIKNMQNLFNKAFNYLRSRYTTFIKDPKNIETLPEVKQGNTLKKELSFNNEDEKIKIIQRTTLSHSKPVIESFEYSELSPSVNGQSESYIKYFFDTENGLIIKKGTDKFKLFHVRKNEI